MPNSPQTQKLKVMLAGLFSLILTMGVARFSYTPLLPVMLDETFLNDASGGWLATINYLGYMCGAIIAASISDLKLKDKLYRIGLVVAILSTVGMGLAENYILWSVMRFIAGLSSAAGLLIGSGLVLNWMLRHGHQPELGLHFSGLGMGIALSAAFAIFMTGDYNWAQQWYIFTVAGVLLAIPAWLWLPKPDAITTQQSANNLVDKSPNKSWMLILYGAYFCAGFGYVISATFLVTIVDQQQALQGKGNLVWLVTGIAASPACIIWDRIARKIGELHALMIAFGLNIIGILIPAIPGFGESLAGVLTSGLFFGATFIGIVSLMLTMVGKFYPTKPAKPMGKLTLSYGAAQILAPALSGTIAESTGNYNMPLILASLIMSFGIVLLVVLKFRQKY
ncbi:MAG: YbfB/YjiJ family MFS transporter [Cocleimonas sp.]